MKLIHKDQTGIQKPKLENEEINKDSYWWEMSKSVEQPKAPVCRKSQRERQPRRYFPCEGR